MDAALQLALVAKAKAVFESDGTFLSFPALNALAYPKEWFGLALGTSQTPDEYEAAAEFSHIVNAIPKGIAFDTAAEEYLWHVYDDVLHRSHAASATLTADEEAARARAMALLYEAAADGTRTDSAALRAYKQYRDAVITAEEELRNAQATAAAGGDAALGAWQAGPGAALRARYYAAQQEWTTKGFKSEVDDALRTEERLAQKGAGGQWTEWQKSFTFDIDRLTNPADGQPFVPTGIVPSDAIDLPSWPTFTLSGDEIRTLAATAPADLKNLLGNAVPSADIVSMTFEYRSVAINRAWFNAKAVRARCWTFDSGELLSDGGTPPAGRCPAYVAGLVLARNIAVTTRQPDGGVRRITIAALPALKAAAVQPAPAVVRDHRTVAVGVGHGGPAGPGLGAGPAPFRKAVFMRLAAADFHVAPIAVAVAPPPPPTTPPPVVTTTDNNISILAAICRWLPKAPDPDPALDW